MNVPNRSAAAAAVIILACAAGGLLVPGGAAAQDARLGTTSFPTSGAEAARPFFVDGVLWLHSFEYDEAAAAFQEAQRLDPGFAMAYWGEAMTHNHGLWFQQDRDAARAVLERLAPTPAERRAKAPTEREKLYLDAVEVLFGPGEKAARDTAYMEAMRALHERFPEDENAAAFYALSILGTSHGGRDIATYMRAAAVAEEVFAANPDHPGAAHYLIHSYDDPVHAPLGLRAARAYSGIAPQAAHAQHMTTHIFVGVGMWDEVVSQNEIASGPDPERWIPGHYTTWLLYGYAQQGRHERAWEHLQAMHERMGDVPRWRHAVARMRADFVVTTERWDSPALDWPVLPPGNFYGTASNDAFVRGFAALKRGGAAETAVAAEALARLVAEEARLAERPDPNDPSDRITAVLVRQLDGLLRLAAGERDSALALLQDAAELEDAMPFEYGPPAVVKPAHELRGEVLLELDRPAEAQRAFERALRLTPRRAPSLLGLARAAAAAGDEHTASRAYATLRDVWHSADEGLPGREEAARHTAGR